MKAMAAATMPDGIYVLGGYMEDSSSFSRTVIRLETEILEWRQAASMKVARGDFTASASGTCDYIYAVGGSTDLGEGGASTDLVERFSIHDNQWEIVAPLNKPRSKHASCLTTILTD